jgi:uncharacterized membrane protein YraQ (UPF0718 family)
VTLAEPRSLSRRSAALAFHEMDSAATRERSVGPFLWVVGALWAVIALRAWVDGGSIPASVRTWATLMLGTTTQAFPFLVLGVTLSAVIAAYVPPHIVARLFGVRASAIPVAASLGAALPGCECSSVPIAARLMRAGGSTGPALSFLLASPAINPVVLVSTAVAFPHSPGMVWGRLGASWLTAVVVGFVFRRARPVVPTVEDHSHGSGRWRTFVEVLVGDYVQAGGFLVIGAATTATMRVVVPTDWVDSFSGNLVVASLAMALLAVVMSVCSEADAFVAGSLTQFPLPSRLVFLVVGPMVDIKLIAQQRAAFGSAFTRRFVPVTLVVAVLAGLGVGVVLV